MLFRSSRAVITRRLVILPCCNDEGFPCTVSTPTAVAAAVFVALRPPFSRFRVSDEINPPKHPACSGARLYILQRIRLLWSRTVDHPDIVRRRSVERLPGNRPSDVCRLPVLGSALRGRGPAQCFIVAGTSRCARSDRRENQFAAAHRTPSRV